MPPRAVSLAILVCWAVAASALLIRDVLPDILVGPPPDLGDVAGADADAGPTRWTILAADRASDEPTALRAVGQVTTRTERPGDGHVLVKSDVRFDSERLLEGTPLAQEGGERIVVHSMIDVDPSGSLFELRSSVQVEGDANELLVIEGHRDRDAIAVKARCPSLPFASWSRRFPYRARGMVQNTLSPMNRLQGLHVGMRWESRVVSPLTGRVEHVHVEVVDRNVMIPWGDGLVPTYVLVTRFGDVEARTWARATDGLVIRQEVPLMIVRLILERQPPDSAEAAEDREREDRR